MIRRPVLLAVWCLCAAAVLPVVVPAETTMMDAALLRVDVTYQEFDPFIPWQKREPGTRDGYGVAIASNRVLTAEHMVRNVTHVELSLPRSGEKVPARVVCSDSQVDLALLEIAPGALPLTPVPIRDTMALRPLSGLTIVQMDRTDEIRTGDATVRSTSMAELGHAPFQAVLTQLTTDISPNNDGIPLVAGDRLAGLTVRHSHTGRTVDVLPGAVLARFVADASDTPHAGFAMAGFQWQPLVDPAERTFYRVPGKGGIRVTSVLPGTGAAEALEPNDVILNWNNLPIDNMGFCIDEDLGRIAFGYLTRFRTRPDDRVPVRLVRDGAVRTELVRVMRFDDRSMLIPENIEGQPEPYLVEGGLILRELTGNFLKERGSIWMRRVNPRLAHLYNTARATPEKPGDRVVFLGGVLPDRINVDYGRFRDRLVTHVNGQAVRNLRDVLGVVDKDGHAVSIRLEAMGVDLVFTPDDLPAANARLAERYRIPALRRPAADRETAHGH